MSGMTDVCRSFSSHLPELSVTVELEEIKKLKLENKLTLN